MKKIALTAVLLLVLFTGTVSADVDQWVPIWTDDPTYAYINSLDLDVTTYDNKHCVLMWIKMGTKKDYLIDHTYFDLDAFHDQGVYRYLVTESLFYSNDVYTSSMDKTKEGWQEPVPGSKYESILHAAVDWMKNEANKHQSSKE